MRDKRKEWNNDGMDPDWKYTPKRDPKDARIELLERKVKVLSDVLIMCEGYISVHDKSGDMIKIINNALKEIGEMR